MYSLRDSRRMTTVEPHEHCAALALAGVVLLFGALLLSGLPAHATTSPTLKIAVFEFELEDVSAAGSASALDTASESTRMQAVTEAARRALAQSGRYSLIDTAGAEAEAVQAKSLRNCDGCEAGIALKLGAQRSLIGVVTRVAQTEYYVSLRIMDTATGKVLKQEEAFFTGADDAWASGAAMLIKHQVLADPNY
jgi:hypothetical protein